MPDHEKEQDRPGYGHHGFFAIRGLPETRRAVLARVSDRSAHRGCLLLLVWITSEGSFSIRMLGSLGRIFIIGARWKQRQL
jgi:hypothetical protein